MTTDSGTPPVADGGTFVLGLDGVPWNLIERWVADGELEHFGRLCSEGAAGPLRSTIPATTPVAWPSIATGTWADQHGLYGFTRLSSTYGHRMNSSTDRKRPALWDLLSPAVVANVPMTFPASGIDGKMVAGMMAPKQDERFVHPPELLDDLKERVPGYEIGLNWSLYHGKEEAFLADLDSMLTNRRRLMRMLMETEEWELFFFVYTAPDRLQHLIWDESVLLDHYRRLDGILGEVMEYVEAHGRNLFVVSDHGFKPIDGVLNVNAYLEREGFLERKQPKGVSRLLDDIGLTKDRVMDALGRAGIDDKTLVKYLPRSFVERVAGNVPGEHGLFDVDHRNTVAFCDGPGNVYVNDADRFETGPVDPSDRGAVKSRVRASLAELTLPSSDEPALEVHDGSDIFARDPRAPDLVVEANGPYAVRSSLGEVFERTEYAGDHHPEGILLAWGPDVEAGSTPEDASVVDVAPTVLHDAGRPVPEDVDGRVLTELFVPDARARTEPVETVAYTDNADTGGRDETASDDEMEAVEDRLRGLGYME